MSAFSVSTTDGDPVNDLYYSPITRASPNLRRTFCPPWGQTGLYPPIKPRFGPRRVPLFIRRVLLHQIFLGYPFQLHATYQPASNKCCLMDAFHSSVSRYGPQGLKGTVNGNIFIPVGVDV